MKKNSYQTKKKQIILEFAVTQKGTHFSANDVYRYFVQNNISISIPTVYRQLEKMTEEGLMQKCRTAQSDSALYYYIEKEEDRHEHSLMKCTGCGKTFPLQCHTADHLVEHISLAHHFFVNLDETVFYGQCEVCKRS
jgi:Fur family ferric uptake transcriptional regulator